MRLTAKERILLHLLESAQPSEEVEVSPALTQKGLAGGAAIELRHLIQFVRPLIGEGLVRERLAHVAGKRQRMKVYGLTASGRASAIRLRERLTSQVIRIRDGDAVRDGSLHEALQGTGMRTTLLDAVKQVERAGVFDLEIARHPPESGYVEQAWDAPRVGSFVGRRDELAEVLREGDGPRIFVIRGVAGIGKSVFAAKVCDLLRGRWNLYWHRVRPWESDATLLAGLGRFLETLDRPGLGSVLKRGQTESVAEVLREDLPDTRAVLIFDDAHEASADTLAFFRMLAEAVAPAPDVRILILTRRALRFYDVRDVVVKGLVREIELRGLMSDETAALLLNSEAAARLVGLARDVAGHPLFIDLVRSNHYDVARAVKDVERFIGESIYRDLSEAEKTTIKAASLYRVAVPREALLSIPGCSYETIESLQDRSLIRVVAGGRYEIHDTIRGFFERVLAPGERHAFGRLALGQLSVLAKQATASGDFVGSIGFLQNALRVVESPEDRRTLYESLGDNHEQLGDVLGLSAAYRAALGIAGGSEVTARLHRKLACVLVDRGYLDAARREIAAGLESLGETESVERGWLDFARARVEEEEYGFKDAGAFAENAARIFERFQDHPGRARALFEAGVAATWAGTVSADGASLAGRCFDEALDLAKALEDHVFEARIHIYLATTALYTSGNREEVEKHLRAVEDSTAAMSDLNIHGQLLVKRAWLATRTRRDFRTAERLLAEAERLARKTHNTITLGDVKFEAGVTAAQEGRYGEGARVLAEGAADVARCGNFGFAADMYFCAAMYSLAAGDWDGCLRILSILHGREFSRILRTETDRPVILLQLEALFRGDVAEFEAGFARILREAESLPVHSLCHSAILWQDHFYFSVGLRALGRDREADAHQRRALELTRSFRNLQGAHSVECDFGDRIAATIRSRIRVA